MNDIKEKFEGWVDDFISRNDGHQKRGIQEIMPDPMDIFEGGAESMHPEISKLTEQNKELILTLKLFIEEIEDYDQWKDMVESTIELIQKVEGE